MLNGSLEVVSGQRRSTYVGTQHRTKEKEPPLTLAMNNPHDHNCSVKEIVNLKQSVHIGLTLARSRKGTLFPKPKRPSLQH